MKREDKNSHDLLSARGMPTEIQQLFSIVIFQIKSVTHTLIGLIHLNRFFNLFSCLINCYLINLIIIILIPVA